MDHHHRHFHFHYLLNREISEIYWTIAIRYFAIALVSIFVPIYLFKQGIPLNYIFLFYAVNSFVWAIFAYISTKLSTKIGLKHNMMIAMPFLMAFFLLLRYINSPGIFFLAAAFNGIQGAFFWTSFHSDFAQFSSKKTRTQQIGGCSIVASIVTAIGPIMGGAFLLFSSFNILFAIVSAILLLAVVPLFMSKEIYSTRSFSLKHVIQVMKKDNIKTMVGFAGFGMMGCAAIAWPIFIFLILDTYLSVGYLTSITLLLAIVSTFFVGRWADKFGKGKILRIGSILTSIVWTIRIFIKTGAHILGINILYGMVGPAGLGGPVFDAINYDSAKKKHIAEIIFCREIGVHAFRMLSCILLFFVTSLPLALALGAIGCLCGLIYSFQRKAI